MVAMGLLEIDSFNFVVSRLCDYGFATLCLGNGGQELAN